MVGTMLEMRSRFDVLVKQQLQSVSSGQGASRTSSICAPENTSRENKQAGGEELEPPQPQPPQQQKRPTLLRVPSITNQDTAGVNNNDVVAYESVSTYLFFFTLGASEI